MKIIDNLKQFVHEIFQDQDGGASMKRTVFFIFAMMFILITGGVYFHAMDAASLTFLQTSLNYMKDIIQWLGATIVGEKFPAAVAALRAPAKTE